MFECVTIFSLSGVLGVCAGVCLFLNNTFCVSAIEGNRYPSFVFT